MEQMNFLDPSRAAALEAYNVTPYNYNVLIARLEPENNLETILDGASLRR